MSLTDYLIIVAIVVAAAALAYLRWGGVVLLAWLSVLWILHNQGRAEGPVLLSLTRSHGLTAADLVGLTGLALASARTWVLVAAARDRLPSS